MNFEFLKKKKRQVEKGVMSIATHLISQKRGLAKHVATVTIIANSWLIVFPIETYAKDRSDISIANTPIIVKGTVSDDTDILPGASVTIKGTNNTVETDDNGNFSIKVPFGDTLVVEFIGYETKEVRVNRDQLKIKLEEGELDSTFFSNIVIYPIGGKTDSTLIQSIMHCPYSTSKMPIIDLGNLVRKLTASAQTSNYSGQPGTTPVMHHFGLSSFFDIQKGEPLPLVVVNGIETDKNVQLRINPIDLSSIRWIFPPESSMTYGDRATTGAIVIEKEHKKNDIEYEGTLSLSQFQKRYKKEKLSGQNIGNSTDWQDELFQNAFGHNHQLSLIRAFRKSVVGLSLGYTKEDGVIVNSGYEELNSHISFEKEVKQRLTIGANANFKRQNCEEVANIANPLRRTPTVLSHKGTDDNLLVKTLLRNSANTIEVKRPPLKRKETDLSGSAYLNLNYNPSWKNSIGFGTSKTVERYFQPFLKEEEDAFHRKGDYREYFLQIKSTLEYDLKYRPSHRVSFKVSAEHNRRNWNGLMTENMFMSTSTDTFGEYDNDMSTSSLYGHMYYTYRNRYYASAGGDLESCSKFASANQWVLLPTFTAGWRINNENFIAETESLFRVIKKLDIKAQYHETANNYSSQAAYFSNLYSWENLKQERSKKYEICLNINIMNKFEIGANMFIKNNTDLLIKTGGPDDRNGLVDPNTIFCNDGAIKNKGFYGSITLTPVAKNEQSDSKRIWQIGLTFTRFNSEVTELGDLSAVNESGDPYGGYQLFNSDISINRTVVGSAPGRFYGYKAEGILNNQAELADYENQTGRKAQVGDIKYSKTRQYIGNPNPVFTYSFNTSLDYGSWTFGVEFNGSYGNEVYNLVRQRTEGRANSAVVSDLYVEDGSYLKVQRVALTYHFPKKHTSHMSIDGMHATIAALNLYTFTNYSGYDPENPGSALRQGVDEGRYPSPRSFLFTFGFKL
ncbi:MAG: carboxypeptidase-like regulatory domain-containing protein [Paludibacteraceae bacterium]|nr:carboxypeptidase-like regulatory domain-containing protein [Paludibacteraceae bacterium]